MLAGQTPVKSDANGATCPAGTMMVPAAGPANTASASIGRSMAGAAKAKLFGKKGEPETARPDTSAAAQYVCATPEQVAAMQSPPPAAGAPPVQATSASPNAGVTSAGAQVVQSGVGSVISGKGKGALIGGAIAAAPLAGRGAKALGSMFGRGGPSREGVIKDLAKGRLQLKTVRFIEGSDALKEGFEAELALLAEALQSVEGAFGVSLAAESDGRSEPDTAMVRRRLAKLSAYLEMAGVPGNRLSVTGARPGPAARPTKPGEARVEIVRVVPEVQP